MKTPKTKICSKCKKRLLATKEFFYKAKSRKDGLNSWCKKCMNTKSRIYRKNNPKRYNAMNRAYRKNNLEKCKVAYRKWTYGVTNEQYVRLLEQQKGVCAICGEPETRIQNNRVQNLSIDHDHNTGEVRGLLCSVCNLKLGQFEALQSFAPRALVYLKIK